MVNYIDRLVYYVTINPRPYFAGGMQNQYCSKVMDASHSYMLVELLVKQTPMFWPIRLYMLRKQFAAIRVTLCHNIARSIHCKPEIWLCVASPNRMNYCDIRLNIVLCQSEAVLNVQYIPWFKKCKFCPNKILKKTLVCLFVSLLSHFCLIFFTYTCFINHI